MQTPTSLTGLRAALKALGFGSALDGLDVGAENAKQTAIAQVEWVCSKKPAAFVQRRMKALHLINLFDWSTVVKAVQQEVPAPDGTKMDVFSKPKKTGHKRYQVKSPTRTVELLAEVERCLKEAALLLDG